MKILITGAAGFLGSKVVELALARGHEPRAFVRRSEDASSLSLSSALIFIGDMTDPASMLPAVAGVEGIIHCAATTSQSAPDWELSRKTNVQGTADLIRAAERTGKPRWIQISSMSAHEGSTSVYGRTKFEADQIVRASLLPWTILQPSIIYGPGEKGLVGKTVKIMRKLPVLPVVGSGRELLRPVYVADVAKATLDCLDHPATLGKSYMIGGAAEMTFDEFMAKLAKAIGVRRPMIHLPISLTLIAARILSLLMRNPPLTPDNVLGVKEARRVVIASAQTDFQFQPMGLDEGLRLTFPNRSPQ